MPAIRTELLGLTILLAAASIAGAAVVKEIRVENVGVGTLDKGLVLAHVAIKPGDTLDAVAVSKDVKALLDTKLFSYVGANVEAVEGGVVLIYSVRNKVRLIEAPTIVGARTIGERKVQEWMGLAVGDLVDDDVLAVAAQKAVAEYQDEHYPDAKITWKVQVTDQATGVGTVRIDVVEGSRAKVAGVEFAGNQAVTSSDLRDAMNLPKWWNPISWFGKHRYDPDEIQLGSESILEVYQDQGYLDVHVDEAALKKVGKDKVIVTIPIQEGVQYRIGKLSISGQKLFPEADLLKQVAVKSGDIASLSKIRASAQAIRDYYGSRGYIRTTVEPVEMPRAPATVDIVFRITEGRLTYIQNIDIVGNTRTKDKVIRRELLVYPGDIYNEVRIRTSEKRLKNLGYFSDVKSYPQETSDPERSDLVFDVEEQRTGQLMVGAGFSTVDRVIGTAELSQGNFDLFGWPTFLGGGQKLRLSAQVGSKEEDYSVSFVEPWFLDRRLSLGLEGYSSRHSYSGYDVQRTGGAVSLGKPLVGPARIDMRYSLEHVKIADVTDTNAYVDSEGVPRPFTNQEDRMESSVSVTITYDTRDSVFIPTYGTHATLTGHLSGGPLGFDTDIYGFRGRIAEYTPLWFKHVLSLEAMAEVIDSYADTESVPLADRLFMGGPQTVRGFKYRDMGPKATATVINSDGTASITHKAYGGRSSAMASAEYTIPVVSHIRLAAFYDIGNAWEDAYQFDLNHLGSSAGIGIRLDIPNFPMRLDYGWVIQKDDPLTGKAPWSFSLGYHF